MKKTLQNLAMGLFALVLAGCAGNSISDQAKEAVGWENAPKWVLNGADGDYSAVGDAPIIDKNVQFARTEATTSARAELAKKIEVIVHTNLRKEGTRVNDQVDEVVKNIVQEAAQRDMQGVRVEDTWIDDDGARIYVLVRLDKSSTKELQNKLSKQFKDLKPSQILATPTTSTPTAKK
ncbi:LPP20 family lipoprotein [Helicobacter mustelae]|uniref:Lipoprotein LPP20-like domain-containing protein n=1 Tax=Helicobacter mustelae (strain ATCC 43772 / CCUG 25715 / CIP 103759 / LMG 18044 / NCTC 12198 / R85-136P) TaxID=679897 RepID=D3UIZ8_HELM1|nr:LPP20 family lipoprotein [Helicobacter mustelae]CBG40473.1 Putative hypothetical protein [Helicobacter mustelae 12198]SQH71972.1 putative lipoprotein [Helicobacter mustelae]STP13115.1 putative lipoprotein [Helicobacter mustelae]